VLADPLCICFEFKKICTLDPPERQPALLQGDLLRVRQKYQDLALITMDMPAQHLEWVMVAGIDDPL
jgi:hypothetical protein